MSALTINFHKHSTKISILVIVFLLCNCDSERILPVQIKLFSPADERRVFALFNEYMDNEVIPGFQLSECPSHEDLVKNSAYVDRFRNDIDLQIFPATIWQVSSLIEKSEWRDLASEYSLFLLSMYLSDNDTNQTPVPGQFMSSCLANGNKQHREMILLLISRYITKTESEKNNSYNSKISINSWQESLLENQLLFFATQETGDPLYRHLAIQNSEKIYQDYFLNHHTNELYYGVANWEKLPDISELNELNSQDFSRLAQCFYGFSLLYNETGIHKYLEISKRLAELFQIIFDEAVMEDHPATKSRALLSDKTDPISRVYISLAFNNMDNTVDARYNSMANRIFNSVLEDLEKAELSDSQQFSFHLFYYLFEYVIQQQKES